ncbi:hypothetical protein BJ508DRAFT_359696 [Ascobolus immersus RN42]|uniref:Uncharacterized protein n=1 Tax=Ascobolus immersus RN42 TaxID=1160509 RepID=A0A3N4IFD1_ASCIM|nr:hypothetical protein BJ508DRAFT_359696 [Ascobolus immersus RN42]
MSNVENTYHMSKEQLRKLESRTSARNDGNIPKDSEAAFMQSVIDKERAHNSSNPQLEMPDMPPPVEGPESYRDESKTSVGVGGRINSHASKETRRDPATQESGVRIDGKEWGKETASDTHPLSKGRMGGHQD